LSLLLPLGAFAAILAAVVLGGTLVAAALFPPGSTFQPERWSWGFVIGAGLVAVQAAATIALGVSPGWIPTLCVFAIAAALTLRARLREIGSDAAPQPHRAVLLSTLLTALLVAGVLF
jgi:hypothetical protein